MARGWSLKKFSAQVVEPQCIPLIGVPEGLVARNEGHARRRCRALQPVKTEEEVESFKGKLDGKIVLMGSDREVKAWFDPMGSRYTDTELLELANAPNPLGLSSGRR